MKDLRGGTCCCYDGNTSRCPIHAPFRPEEAKRDAIGEALCETSLRPKEERLIDRLIAQVKVTLSGVTYEQAGVLRKLFAHELNDYARHIRTQEREKCAVKVDKFASQSRASRDKAQNLGWENEAIRHDDMARELDAIAAAIREGE